MPSPGPRRWLRRVLIAAGVVLLLAAGAVVAVILHSPGNVSHPNVEFTAPTTSTTAPARPKPKRVVNNFQWPRYGYDLARTRAFPNSSRLDPPLHRGWKYNDGALLEFPPVIYQNTLYLIDDNGSARAINKLNGHELWKRQVGTLAAASPAVDARDHLIIVPLLSVSAGARLPSNGRLLALSMKTGRTVWTHVVGAGTETSPTVFGHSVYYGDQAGNVASLQTRTGHVNWVYHASGPVKGGPTVANGTLYFGDYSGHVYAVNAFNGHQVWRVGTSGTHFGFGSGNFYSTAAVAFGRVYIGNTDGRVYSFAQRTGQLAWATSTGAYVYGSPAIAEIPGLGPTVYVGSYDDSFYAFDARSGAVRWKHPAGGKISGSATIVGNVVYYSNLGTKSTAGLDVRTGQKVFAFSDGAFNPVIADPSAIYMVGYGAIYQFLPERASKTSGGAQHTRAPTERGRKRRGSVTSAG